MERDYEGDGVGLASTSASSNAATRARKRDLRWADVQSFEEDRGANGDIDSSMQALVRVGFDRCTWAALHIMKKGDGGGGLAALLEQPGP